MKRRAFIAALGSAAAWPLVARGQQQPIPVIGFLHQGARDANEQFLAKFRQGLRDTGYVEGQNVTIEFRWAEGHYDRLEMLVTDLVRRQVSIIVAAYRPAAMAAKSATTIIPIVFASGSDPVQNGLVPSLSHPGGNITGIYLDAGTMAAKRLELLRELVPRLGLIAALLNPANNNFKDNVKALQAASQAFGQQIEFVSASTDKELSTSLARLTELRPGALFVSPDSFLTDHRDQLIAWTAHHNVPAMYYDRLFVDDGGLLSYASDHDQQRWSGIYVGRILKGEQPADLPIMQVTKIELLINLKTAKALGLEIPPSLLARADEVIE